MNTAQNCFFTYACCLVALLLSCGCGKNPPDPSGSESAPVVKRDAAPTSGAEATANVSTEDRVASLYAQYQKALRVDLSAQEISGLPARAAESARRSGEFLDLELLSAPGGNVDVVRKVYKQMFRQLEVFYEALAKEPREVQGMFRAMLAGGGLRNPVFVGKNQVAFETDANIHDRAEQDLFSDIYSWDYASGEVRCKSIGSGVDGDWACVESSLSASGEAFVFERQFKGESDKMPNDSFAGIVWLATASAMAPLTMVENWVPDGGFVPIKAGDRRFLRWPVISGDGKVVAVVCYFSPSENDRRDYGD